MSRHPSLARGSADLIGGEWASIGGDSLVSHNPARPERVVWSGSPVVAHVDGAVAAARKAFETWSRWPRERRFAVLRRYQQIAAARAGEMAALLRDEVGKPMWDARAEAQLLAGKVEITLENGAHAAMNRVSGYELDLGGTRAGRASFRPHGVMAVVGPFNFPAHLPNGHIVPALAMGNTVVFKPSDKTPGVGQLLCALFDEALRSEGAPPGVVNLVQGGGDIASRLTAHEGIDGVLFTGSWPVGRRIMRANLDHPGRILALEMGGDNPAIVLGDADLRQSVIECVRCAFITAGQRCTCTRRVIVHEEVAAKLIPALCKAASNLIIGDPAAEYPVFLGPVIREEARAHVLHQVGRLARGGGELLVQPEPGDGGTGGWYLTPGVMRVERFIRTPDGAEQSEAQAALLAGADIEVFGPFLRISTCRDLDDAIEQANATEFGLAASIFTRDAAAVEEFFARAKAGCLNVNTGTAGASSRLPFGGLGRSGNHRPAGAFSLDYCAYPVAGMLERGSGTTISPGMRFEDSWLI